MGAHEPRVCEGCGDPLESKRRHARFCSGACRAEGSRRRRLESARAFSGELPGRDRRFYRPARPAHLLLRFPGLGRLQERERAALEEVSPRSNVLEERERERQAWIARRGRQPQEAGHQEFWEREKRRVARFIARLRNEARSLPNRSSAGSPEAA